jgi:photosystem II stability/assembly factor-like uncharacterized protein
VGDGIAWASGSGGTILRTTNGGETWQTCALPPDAEKLDFRGIQAFDGATAVVMSSGPGDHSRIYKTTDSCQSWKLVFTNPDKEGFLDALQFSGASLGALIGDPVNGHFPVFLTEDGGNTWHKPNPKGIAAQKNQSLFAASNSSMLLDGRNLIFVTGGGTNALIRVDLQLSDAPVSVRPDLAIGAAAGGFSLATRTEGSNLVMVTVGGDYKLPAQATGTAVTCIDDRHGSIRCAASATPPGGYRSAVAYDDATKTWIAVGPNGTDVSTDDGRDWRPAKPAQGAAPDASQNWNAISLPFAVGGNGRIGKLHAGGL